MDPNLQLNIAGQSQYIQHPPSAAQSHSVGLAPHQQQVLQTFWANQMAEIQHGKCDFKLHQLPLARIKKVMKTDEDVKMISAEAPILFAKSCEIMILELTLRAWMHAEENKRRTLQRSDIATAITKTDMFDFLIDIVPREESIRATKAHDKPDFNSNMSHEQPNYSYMTYHVSPGGQYGSAAQPQLASSSQGAIPQQSQPQQQQQQPSQAQPQHHQQQQQQQQQQLMQMQYLRNQLLQQPGAAPQSPIQVSQPNILQAQASAGMQGQPQQSFYPPQYGYSGGNVTSSQGMLSPQGHRGTSQYGNPPRQ
ncbi:CCAAT- binding transcription factor component [Dispira parvispora]|uniref:CCAAT- binding transcription factor component n=1 Tax=Dispira parvispora TaxID=1520584 RepID=A0A9W8AKD9_9FUNG|nr:CCAAT- binding transcription factor component [Dispira parvispora]